MMTEMNQVHRTCLSVNCWAIMMFNEIEKDLDESLFRAERLRGSVPFGDDMLKTAARPASVAMRD